MHIKAYVEIGEENRALLKIALRSIYVKDKYDLAKFNKIFEEIFKDLTKEDPLANGEFSAKAQRFKLAKSKYVIKQVNSQSKAIQKEKVDNENVKKPFRSTVT